MATRTDKESIYVAGSSSLDLKDTEVGASAIKSSSISL
jgi:hypothetical protein